MLQRFRQPGSATTNIGLWVALAALALQSVLPVGYMVGWLGQGDSLTVMLCPVQGALPAARQSAAGAHAEHGAAGDTTTHSTDRQAASHQADPETCPFELAGALALAPFMAPASSLLPPAAASPALRALPYLPADRFTRLARGPPTLS